MARAERISPRAQATKARFERRFTAPRMAQDYLSVYRALDSNAR